MIRGKVWLVGAGPGAPDLLTVRAAELLRRADVVFHDALVHADTLALAAGARRVAVGKRCGVHATAQHFINKQLIDAARHYSCVVRLKGGDPMLFGRAQEEIDSLSKAGVAWEVVPGVTAAMAASAELGISLTRRGVSRSVTLATPRIGRGEQPNQWLRAVAGADTGVIYMGAGEAEAISENLLSEGMAPLTPVMVMGQVSLSGSWRIRTTLAELPDAKFPGEGPVLLMIGQVFDAGESAGVALEMPAHRRLAS